MTEPIITALSPAARREALREKSPSGWVTPTLAGSFVQSTPPLQYRRRGDVVELRGVTNTGTTGTVFTLPEGFRPPVTTLRFTGTPVSTISIATTGVVSVTTSGSALKYYDFSFSTTA